MIKHYYNEFDKGAATWLRELIAVGELPPGDVDERSIKDVRASDLRDYVSCHFFAGIGIWPAALRRSGWAVERPVGTGSCPCQGFSLAGKGLGFDDPRHLFPDWLRLIDEAREQGQPWVDALFIEQVASAGEWLDLVQSSMEARGYAFGATDLPAAGFAQGAHIRQRFYGVADRHNAERWADVAGRDIGDWPQTGRIEGYGEPGAGGAVRGLADGAGGQPRNRDLQPRRQHGQQSEDGGAVRLGVAQSEQYDGRRDARGGWGESSDAGVIRGLGHHHHHHHAGSPQRPLTPDERGAIRVEGPTLGAAGSLLGCDWLLCHDARVRPVEAGTFPLASKDTGRLGKLRGYGNALDFQTAVNFISAYMEACDDRLVLDLV